MRASVGLEGGRGGFGDVERALEVVFRATDVLVRRRGVVEVCGGGRLSHTGRRNDLCLSKGKEAVPVITPNL